MTCDRMYLCLASIARVRNVLEKNKAYACVGGPCHDADESGDYRAAGPQVARTPDSTVDKIVTRSKRKDYTSLAGRSATWLMAEPHNVSPGSRRYRLRAPGPERCKREAHRDARAALFLISPVP